MVFQMCNILLLHYVHTVKCNLLELVVVSGCQWLSVVAMVVSNVFDMYMHQDCMCSQIEIYWQPSES